MTPNDIEILLHYYTTPIQHERIHVLGVAKAIASFIERGIIVIREENEFGNPYEVTEKGEKLVEMLCNTPDPVNKWMDPRIKEQGVRS